MKELNADQFVEYCRQNNGSDEKFKGTAENLLSFWREAKSEYLYDLLGGEFILSKECLFEKDSDEIDNDISSLIRDYTYSFIHPFMIRLVGTVCPEHCEQWQDFIRYTDKKDENFDTAQTCYNIYRLLNRGPVVKDNRVDFNGNINIDGHRVVISEGQKIMKLIGKIAAILNLTVPFEAYRIAYSQVMNQKKIHGILNLSIHPLDYATASDNECGWSSCMSWRESGCYRLGTVEMMNSPCVICAYVSSTNSVMSINDEDWPSKKWRAWIIVTKDVILCNRNYPYDNDEIAKSAIKWVAELAHKNMGWDFNCDNICRYEDSLFSEYNIHFYTDAMYNDVSNDMWICVSSDVNDDNVPKDINFSGVCNCMNCGERIDKEDAVNEPARLCCNNCQALHYCSNCGCSISERDIHYGPNDEELCDSCYYDTISHCEECDEDCYTDDIVHFCMPQEKNLTIPNEKSASQTERINCPILYEAFICDDCVRRILGNASAYDATNANDITSILKFNWYGVDWIDPTVVTLEQAKEIFNISSYREEEEANFETAYKHYLDLYTKYTSAN